MSKREDITTAALGSAIGFGLVYTKVLGWIDLGHAQGNDARKLQSKLREEKGRSFYPELNEWYFPVDYYQEMALKIHKSTQTNLWAGVHAPLMVRSCLSWEIKKRIALTIMMKTASRFEALQDSSLVNWRTDSGFSGEDLVSDLLGFYRVFGEGIDPLILAQPTEISYGKSIWDHYGAIGKFKNRGFRPILFPQPSPGKTSIPRISYLPTWLDYIKPLGDLSNKYISNRYFNRPKKDLFDDVNRMNNELYIALRRGYQKPNDLHMPSHVYVHPHNIPAPDYFHIGGDSQYPIW